MFEAAHDLRGMIARLRGWLHLPFPAGSPAPTWFGWRRRPIGDRYHIPGGHAFLDQRRFALVEPSGKLTVHGSARAARARMIGIELASPLERTHVFGV